MPRTIRYVLQRQIFAVVAVAVEVVSIGSARELRDAAAAVSKKNGCFPKRI